MATSKKVITVNRSTKEILDSKDAEISKLRSKLSKLEKKVDTKVVKHFKPVRVVSKFEHIYADTVPVPIKTQVVIREHGTPKIINEHHTAVKLNAIEKPEYITQPKKAIRNSVVQPTKEGLKEANKKKGWYEIVDGKKVLVNKNVNVVDTPIEDVPPTDTDTI